jgi:ParB-like chromosome segregation protein Spo0J
MADVTDSQEKKGGGSLVIQVIDTSLIAANSFNPNRMSDEEFGEYLAEVRRLGRLPKPIVVRQNGECHYDIVDGEYALRAAKEVGLEDVPCEVIDADEFEARRQCLKRNQHGRTNPVRLGRMFREMMDLRKLSLRELEQEIKPSEGTIRNALLFAEGAELRNRYAPEGAEDKIARLTVKQVRAYVNLPESERDRWLDDGADLAAIQASGPGGASQDKPEAAEAPPRSAESEPSETATPAVAEEESPQARDGPIGPNGEHPTGPDPRASEVPTNQTEGVSTEPARVKGSKRPAAKDDEKVLNRLRAAWEQASKSVRRKFLTWLLGDQETAELIQEVMASSGRGGSAKNRQPAKRSR